ncbi:hypothetical protein DERF_008675 [Dermatophagoides farinae]|uniref:Uncharacterized protein n=1 Tax=Dermatophagoides farinae TaxID=6954 RepID=A0A922I3Q6_DERFA|nr:hypothetical protein DERF_008675 [Dermatophagoides farinae]
MMVRYGSMPRSKKPEPNSELVFSDISITIEFKENSNTRIDNNNDKFEQQKNVPQTQTNDTVRCSRF